MGDSTPLERARALPNYHRTSFDAGRRYVIRHHLLSDEKTHFDACLGELTKPEKWAKECMHPAVFARLFIDGYYAQLRANQGAV
jgi:hypothetical protein